MCEGLVPVVNRVSVRRCVQSLRCYRIDHHVFWPVLLLLLHQVRHQTPEPVSARGLRQTRHQGQGGADRGGSGGPFLCLGNVNGARCFPVPLHVSLRANGSFIQNEPSLLISHRVKGSFIQAENLNEVWFLLKLRDSKCVWSLITNHWSLTGLSTVVTPSTESAHQNVKF